MRILLIILTVLFFVTSCELLFPLEPELPPITAEGKGTFGCVVNGEVWLPDERAISTTNDLDAWIDTDSSLYIGARNVPEDQKIELHLNDFYIENKEIEFTIYPYNSVYVILGTGCIFQSDSSSGYFEILKNDTINQIIAGTFEFTIFEECDTLHVSEGRFDLGYNYNRR